MQFFDSIHIELRANTVINAGFYLLARFEAIADKKIYSASRYIISGHSLEHLCLAMVPIILTVMLWFRSIKIARYMQTV